MEFKDVQDWMEGYIEAWNSNDPQDIGRLFTAEARYYTTPHRKPWQGRQEIVSSWLNHKDEPDEFEFHYEILGLDGQRGFVRGWTTYIKEAKAYSNIWVITLTESGECQEFIEWWMGHKVRSG